MNKKIKKLSLAKETLRNLSGESLKMAAGGITLACTETQEQGCSDASCFRTCDTCYGSCARCPSQINSCIC